MYFDLDVSKSPLIKQNDDKKGFVLTRLFKMTKKELISIAMRKNSKITQKIHNTSKKDKIMFYQEIESYKEIHDFFNGKQNKMYKKYRYMKYNCLRKVANYENLPIYVLMNDQSQLPFCSQNRMKNTSKEREL